MGEPREARYSPARRRIKTEPRDPIHRRRTEVAQNRPSDRGLPGEPIITIAVLENFIMRYFTAHRHDPGKLTKKTIRKAACQYFGVGKDELKRPEQQFRDIMC